MQAFAKMAILPCAVVGAVLGLIAAVAGGCGGSRAPFFGRLLSVLGSVIAGAFGGYVVGLFVGYGIVGPALGILSESAESVARDGWTLGRLFDAFLGVAWLVVPVAVVVAAFRHR